MTRVVVHITIQYFVVIAARNIIFVIIIIINIIAVLFCSQMYYKKPSIYCTALSPCATLSARTTLINNNNFPRRDLTAGRHLPNI